MSLNTKNNVYPLFPDALEIDAIVNLLKTLLHEAENGRIRSVGVLATVVEGGCIVKTINPQTEVPTLVKAIPALRRKMLARAPASQPRGAVCA